MRKRFLRAVTAAVLMSLAACTTSRDAPTIAQTTAPPTPARTAVPAATVTPTMTRTPMAETRLRFSAGDAGMVVRLNDSPTSRDLVSRLPLTLTFEDFAGREKISYLPERLTRDGSPGSAPGNGSLIYYVPWGNIGFFYDADGGHDDNLVTLGTVESGLEHIDRFEGRVTVTVIH
ncbi:cyclophilin-like fold protein [Kribbella sp. NPDC050820]|uniref:cyclophilin-like fold protein n=1 Tax=Kribbella sp. NPDC050820 TaxID=3155408 RepID=UPI00340941EF